MSETSTSTDATPVAAWQVVDDSSDLVHGVRFVDNEGWETRIAFYAGVVATIVNTSLGTVGPVVVETERFGGYPGTPEGRISFGAEYARQMKAFMAEGGLEV
jgi:hypothetical protein